MKKKTKKSSTKSQPKPAKKQPSSRQLAHRTYMRKAAKLAPPKRTVSKPSSNTRPSKVRRQKQSSPTRSHPAPIVKRQAKANESRGTRKPNQGRKHSTISRTAKALRSEAAKTSKTIQRNLKASKKAVKQLRDALGHFTAAYKKFSNRKAKELHAAKQLAASKAAAKSTKKNQGRKSATKPRTTKAPVSTPRPVRSNRGQGKGNKERARLERASEVARNKPTRLRGVKAGKESYRLQELASSKSKNLGKLLAKIEERTDQIDALKRPDQMWAFQIYDRHSLVPYESIGGMMEFLQASGGLINSAKEDTGLWTKVSILTKGEAGQPMANTVLDYRREVEARQLAQREENAATMRAATARFGGKTSEGRRKSKYQLLAQAEARIAELEKATKKGKQ